MRRFLTGLAGVLALAACAPTETKPTPPVPEAGGDQSFSRDMSASDRSACLAGGGKVERRGRIGAELCVRPFADAGKACTDSAQCAGKCVSAGNTETPPTAGQCQADDRLFGCYAEIKGGTAASTICVD